MGRSKSKSVDFSKLVRQNIRLLQPYRASEIPCRVKLDANESPYSLRDKKPLSSDATVLGRLNRYPDPEAKELKRAIAKKHGGATDSILLGNGSDELIYYLIIAFGGPVLYPVPTFSMYGIIAQALGEQGVGISLDEDFDLDVDAMSAAIKKHRPKLIFLSSPNNPTGNCFSSERILKIIELSKGIVILDEAYQPFSSERGFLPLLKDYRNLAILRTLSKTGFAALRVGYLLGDKGLVAEVNKVRLPFNLNALSQAVALEAFRKKPLIQRQIHAIVAERERVFRALQAMRGVTAYPSEANFILFKVPNAHKVFQGLIKQGVLIRNMQGAIKDALRVTIGTPRENTIFLEALKTVLCS